MDKHTGDHITVSRSISVILIVIACIAIAVGVFHGEARSVLQKATLICLECIGLG